MVAGFKKLSALLRPKVFRKNSNKSGYAITSIKSSSVTPQRIMVFGDSHAFRPDGSKRRWTILLKEKNPAVLNIFTEGYDGRTTTYDVGECNRLGD